MGVAFDLGLSRPATDFATSRRPIRHLIRPVEGSMLRFGPISALNKVLALIFITNISLLVRWLVGLNGYSGFGKPPMFGDFEAQRHWMEVTVNLPIKQWYQNSTNNDLLYWGLDYPPLTAYHSWINGQLATAINSSWNALTSSRGLEDPSHKLFMRWTVIMADLLLLFPPTFTIFSQNLLSLNNCFEQKIVSCLLSFLNPSLLLIDHGHFQYNGISLGLSLWTFLLICNNRFCLATVAFCLSLNYKQMQLYHAVPFFIFLLKKCSDRKSLASKLDLLLKLSLMVLITFVIVWSPLLFTNDKEGIIQVLRRIFPFNRGLFEDKVASVWCALQPVLRLKEFGNQHLVVRLCLASTAISFIPDCVLLWRLPSPRNLIFSLTSVSLSFFLFSYHVHEKSILLATVPASFLIMNYPFLTVWFITIATGSMFPLLCKDSLMLSTISILLFYYLIFAVHQDKEMKGENIDSALNFRSSLAWINSAVKGVAVISVVMMVILCACHLGASPPSRFPDLFSYLLAAFSCVNFMVFKLILLYLMSNSMMEKSKRD